MNRLHFDRSGDAAVDLTRTGRAAESQTPRTQTNAATPLKPTASNATDGITLSSRATRITELAERVKQLPDIRSERVAHLRAEIEADIYQPRALDIAAAISRHGGW